jgi:hypothetical protein
MPFLLYYLPSDSISSLSALVGHSIHLPFISNCAFQLLFYLLAYNQNIFFAALVWSTLWQWSPTSNSGYSLVHTNVYKTPGYDQVRLGSCSSWSTWFWRIVCQLSRCSREVQLGLPFGFACCHILLTVNLFLGLKRHERGWTVFSVIISPVHNMTRLRDAPALQVRLIRIRIHLSKLTVRLL